jgi:protein required for attachment to host cells
MPTTWVVAADSSRARIFELMDPDWHIQEIEDMVNPQGRARNRELQSDSYGRYYGKGERDQGHAVLPHVEAGEHQTELFSKAIGEYLDKARTEHRYDKLHLIAPPKFLGLIRQNLSQEAQKLVEVDVAKDVSRFQPRDIQEYLDSKRYKSS